MTLAWFFEIAKTLGCAVVISLIFVFLRTMLPLNGAKATGFAVLRAQGYSLMFVGVLTILLGLLLSCLGGRTLLR